MSLPYLHDPYRRSSEEKKKGPRTIPAQQQQQLSFSKKKKAMSSIKPPRKFFLFKDQPVRDLVLDRGETCLGLPTYLNCGLVEKGGGEWGLEPNVRTLWGVADKGILLPELLPNGPPPTEILGKLEYRSTRRWREPLIPATFVR